MVLQRRNPRTDWGKGAHARRDIPNLAANVITASPAAQKRRVVRGSSHRRVGSAGRENKKFVWRMSTSRLIFRPDANLLSLPLPWMGAIMNTTVMILIALRVGTEDGRVQR